jgi:PST family polysaccharide transporter
VTLIKTSLLNAIAVVIRMLTLFGINKILAVYVGPSGYAAIGQFQSAVLMITTFASGAINNGIIKYTAEYQDDKEKQVEVWRTAGTASLIGALITGTIVLLFSRTLSVEFLNDEKYTSVFYWFAATLVFFTFNSLLLAVLNGKKEISTYVIASIIGSLFSLVVTSVLVISYGLYGALVSLVVYQSLSFFITLWLCKKTSWFKVSYFFGGVDKHQIKNLGKFAAMASTTAICVPLSHIFIRDYLSVYLGVENAGYWEATWRLSTAYLTLVTATLSVYYLPRLSELKTKAEIKGEILQGYKFILPVAAFFAFLMYVFRDLIINILFSSEFIVMETLIGWQVTGDTLKIGSWILAYLMVSKALTKIFIFTEIFFAFSFYALTICLVPEYGLKGVAIAHAVNYLIYWIVVAVVAKIQLQKTTVY